MIYLMIVMVRSKDGSFENWRLHREFDGESLWIALGILLGLCGVAVLVRRLIGERFVKTKKYKNDPLTYEKIIVDQSNQRSGIRVPFQREIMFESAHFPGRQKPLPPLGQVVDLSYRGMAFLSTLEFPLDTNINFNILETEFIASPTMTGVVVASREWQEKSPEGEVLYLTSLNLKNLGEQANSFLAQIISEKERVLLAHEREKKENPEKKG